MTGNFPGIGLKLPLALSNAQEPVWASMRTATYTIPSGSFSMGIAANSGLATSFNVLFGTAPAGTAFEIRYDINPDFSTEYVLDTVAASGTNKAYTWSVTTLSALDGFIRIKNTGGQDVTAAYVQQTASFSN